jgi:hypothetical protein
VLGTMLLIRPTTVNCLQKTGIFNLMNMCSMHFRNSQLAESVMVKRSCNIGVNKITLEYSDINVSSNEVYEEAKAGLFPAQVKMYCCTTYHCRFITLLLLTSTYI